MHCTPPSYGIDRSGSKHDAGTNPVPFCLCTGVDYEKVLSAEPSSKMQPLPSCSCAML